MPPFFNPGSIQYPDIKISMAAVNPFMLNVAGELCDGVILHSFNSLKYTNDVIIPNIKKGVTKAGRSMDDIAIAAGGMIIVAKDENDLIIKKEQTKKRIAFYASTKSYSDIMAVHGWQDTHEKLYRMSIDGDWDNMSSHITDEMLDTFAVTGIYEDISCKIKDAYASYASQISFDMEVTTPSEEEILIHIINQLKS
jgi:probable F420-dependent oxidoreductase